MDHPPRALKVLHHGACAAALLRELDRSGIAVVATGGDDAPRAADGDALLLQADAPDAVASIARARAADELRAIVAYAEALAPEHELALLHAGADDVVGASWRLPRAIRRAVAASRERRLLRHVLAQLHRSQHGFREVFLASPTAMLVLDAETLAILEANRAAERMFDYAANQLTLLTLAELGVGDAAQALREPCAALRRGELERARLELRLRRSDASELWVDLSLAVLARDGDQAGTLLASLLNVSLRKQAEASSAAREEQLSGLRAELERRVQAQTADLRAQTRRLQALYRVSALAVQAGSLEQLAGRFVVELRRLAGAMAIALYASDAAGRRGELLACDGVDAAALPELADALASVGSHARATLRGDAGPRLCLRVPVRTRRHRLGELELYFTAEAVGDDEIQLYDALAQHLAGAMEALRAAAYEREAAVTAERGLLARELHDSIAQALAFMNIQLQLLRGAFDAGDAERAARALDELDAGLQESSEDVRELLLHFRTRSRADDIEPALRSTLQKFELQCDVPVQLDIDTRGRALAPDVQIQILHIVQEALSNVRKHARANRVSVRVRGEPRWRFEISDDGRGFDAGPPQGGAHVGLQIMRERAAQIGAWLWVDTMPGDGTRVGLEWPAAPARGAADAR
jgi:PAS domain S-box-containing protein